MWNWGAYWKAPQCLSPRRSSQFTTLTKWLKGRCEYTSGFLYDSPQKASEGLVAGQIPAHRAVKVNHRGPYRHLGNAWMTAMGYVRAKHKANKALPMYETYPNNPNEVEEKDVQVEIYLPVKG